MGGTLRKRAARRKTSGAPCLADSAVGVETMTSGAETECSSNAESGAAPTRPTAPAADAGQAVDAALGESTAGDAQFEAELRRAIERQEFRVFFEPILSLNTNRIMGFEALLRWRSPRRGLLAPAAFLPVAEETGLIVPIGLWVLHRACQQARTWQVRHPQTPPLVISVNLSATQFERPDLVEQVHRVLEETGLAPDSLRLEITETVVVKNPETARAMLLQLRALDVKLGIDDFGAGYSSLSYVRKFPVHTLKIDRSFISALESQKENLEIVRAIITMSRNLGFDVIAEGVETAGQLALLKLLRCDYGQGHFLSKPLDDKQAEALIRMSLGGRFERCIPQLFEGRAADSAGAAVPCAPDAALAPPAPSADSAEAQVERIPAATPARRDLAQWKAVFLGALLFVAACVGLVSLWGWAGRPQDAAPPEARGGEATTLAEGPLLLREIQSAMAAGRYILPPDGNAVFFCNQLLDKNPQDAAVRVLKEQSIRAGLSQALDSARAGDADTARRLYVALQSLLKDDALFAGLQEAQQGLRNISYSNFAVVHDHFLDSCQGDLKFNAYTISFVPREGGKHGFTERMSDITARMDGKFLKLDVAGKTYRFKSAPAAHAENGRSDMNAIHQKIVRRLRATSGEAGSPAAPSSGAPSLAN